jgi:hypothetical protein
MYPGMIFQNSDGFVEKMFCNSQGYTSVKKEAPDNVVKGPMMTAIVSDIP